MTTQFFNYSARRQCGGSLNGVCTSRLSKWLKYGLANFLQLTCKVLVLSCSEQHWQRSSGRSSSSSTCTSGTRCGHLWFRFVALQTCNEQLPSTCFKGPSCSSTSTIPARCNCAQGQEGQNWCKCYPVKLVYASFDLPHPQVRFPKMHFVHCAF